MASIRGRVTQARTVSASISGSVTLTGSGPQITGTVYVDRTLVDAYLASTRWVDVKVWIAPAGTWELATGLIDKVRWVEKLDDVTATLDFTLSDPRVPRFASPSLCDGGVPVRVYLTCRSARGGGTWLAFDGVTAAAQNVGNYRPHATFSCVSRSATWADLKGSIASRAYGGKTRGKLIQEWADYAGGDATDMIIPDGKGVSGRVEMVSVTGQELLERFAELEGWRFRPKTDGSGTIEILPGTYTRGASRFDFHEGNTFTPTEEPPSRPVTRWTLTGQTVQRRGRQRTATTTVEGLSTVTSEGTSATVTVTYDGPAEVYRKIEERGADGGLVRTTEVWTRWMTTRVLVDRFGDPTADSSVATGYGYVPSARMSTRKTLVSEKYNPRCAANIGSWGADGVRRIGASPSFMPVMQVDETMTWSATGCELLNKITEVKRYHSRLNSNQGLPRVDTFWSLQDGSQPEYRDPQESMQTVSYETTVYSSGVGAAVASHTVKAMAVVGYVTRSDMGDPDLTYPVEDLAVVNVQVNGVALMSGGQYEQMSAGATGGGTTRAQDGVMPQPPSASASEPQVAMEPMQITLAVGSSGFPARFGSATLPDAQSKEELTRAATRRIEEGREGFATRYRITHPGLPYLSVGDPVTVTDAVRNLSARAGFIEAITRSVDVLNGWYEQTTDVVVPWRMD